MHFRVDIGLPSSNVETKADQKLRLELVKKNRQNAALEQKSRTRQRKNFLYVLYLSLIIAQFCSIDRFERDQKSVGKERGAVPNKNNR